MNRGEKSAGTLYSRRRTVAAVGVATVVPASTLLIALELSVPFQSSGSALVAALTGAFVALALRGIGSLARWLVLGPGLLFDRLLWAIAFAACISIAVAWKFELSELLIAYLAYFGILTIVWAVSAAMFSVRPRVRQSTPFRLSLGDLMTALAAFGFLIGAGRFLLADLRRVDSYDLPFLFVASTLGSFVVVAVALFVDAGVRFLAIGAEATDGRMLMAIGFFFVGVCVATGLGTALVSNAPELAAISGFASAYLAFAAAQEEFLARTVEK